MYTTPQLVAEYSAIADPYSRLWSPVIRPMALPMLEMLPLAQACDVLDVGAGTGELLEDLARRAPRAHIVAVDRSEGTGVRVWTADLEKLAMLRRSRLSIRPG